MREEEQEMKSRAEDFERFYQTTFKKKKENIEFAH